MVFYLLDTCTVGSLSSFPSIFFFCLVKVQLSYFFGGNVRYRLLQDMLVLL